MNLSFPWLSRTVLADAYPPGGAGQVKCLELGNECAVKLRLHTGQRKASAGHAGGFPNSAWKPWQTW